MGVISWTRYCSKGGSGLAVFDLDRDGGSLMVFPLCAELLIRVQGSNTGSGVLSSIVGGGEVREATQSPSVRLSCC